MIEKGWIGKDRIGYGWWTFKVILNNSLRQIALSLSGN